MSSLSTKQERAALLLVSGRTTKQVAEEVGVRPETLTRWKGQPEFVALLNQLRAEALQAAVDKLRLAAADAAQGLIELSRADDVPPDVRRRACLDVLGYTSIQFVINQGIGADGS